MEAPLLLAKITVVLIGAWAAGFAWHRSPRRVHQMWTLVFAAVVALPGLADVLPALKLPVMAAWIEPRAIEPPSPLREAPHVAALDDAIPEIVRFDMSPPSVQEPAASATRLVRPDARMIALGIWLAGTRRRPASCSCPSGGCVA